MRSSPTCASRCFDGCSGSSVRDISWTIVRLLRTFRGVDYLVRHFCIGGSSPRVPHCIRFTVHVGIGPAPGLPRRMLWWLLPSRTWKLRTRFLENMSRRFSPMSPLPKVSRCWGGTWGGTVWFLSRISEFPFQFTDVSFVERFPVLRWYLRRYRSVPIKNNWVKLFAAPSCTLLVL